MLLLKRIQEDKESELDFIRRRLVGRGEGTYYSLPLLSKLDLLCRFCSFSSEDKYSVANHAKTFFYANPEERSTTFHGNMSEKDFYSKDGRINVQKMLDYIVTNYPLRKANRLLFDNWIAPNGEYIAHKEYRSKYRVESSSSLRSFVNSRLGKDNRSSYYQMPLREKMEILRKYGDFDSEQEYTLVNKSKTIFDSNPTKKSTYSYGDVTYKDFENRNTPKLLEYLSRHYQGADSLFYSWIITYGEDIATREYKDKYSD